MARPRARLDLSALADAFAADGLHGVSTAELAAALEVAKPTLYAHGSSKEALFLRAVEAEVERVIDRLHGAERATVGMVARDRAAASVRALLDHAAARPAGARLLHRTAHHASSEVADRVAAALRRVPDRLTEGLRRDLAADGLDPERAPFLARALYGAASALAEVRPGERRPSRAVLAGVAAQVVPMPASVPAEPWPTA
ncbi:TetR/AcrR family transcriptional regulator [Paraconexibacter sp.]|uniref:TetR/AcrR family transcriptional regulator n=1 Tax=Paraconexibacter sp. TaxID=2949640 RepID=UPI00356A8411